MKRPDKPDVPMMDYPVLFEKQPPVSRDSITDNAFQDTLN